MKSLLILTRTTLVTLVTLLALASIPAFAQIANPPPTLAPAAQSPAASPAATPASAQPVPPRPSPTPGGNTHDAAATVPLPGLPSGPVLEQNLPLIPENAPAETKSGRHAGRTHPGATPRPYATFQTEHDLRIRIHLREAETRALNDPSIQADWIAAHHTRTDPERRTLLAVYYNHLYDRMIKIDPSITAPANLRRTGLIARMKYTRLGDTTNAEDPFVQGVPAVTGPNPPAVESTVPEEQ